MHVINHAVLVEISVLIRPPYLFLAIEQIHRVISLAGFSNLDMLFTLVFT